MGNYFCGNSSAGGWVGYDDPRGANKTQGLSAQLPTGFDFDPTDTLRGGPFLASMKDPAGAIFHAWRDQARCSRLAALRTPARLATRCCLSLPLTHTCLDGIPPALTMPPMPRARALSPSRSRALSPSRSRALSPSHTLSLPCASPPTGFFCPQGWFVNMFEVESSSADAGSVTFAKMESYGVEHVKGGWQGGRGWQVSNPPPPSLSLSLSCIHTHTHAHTHTHTTTTPSLPMLLCLFSLAEFPASPPLRRGAPFQPARRA